MKGGGRAGGLAGAALILLSAASARAERVLLLPLEHPGLEPDVVEALERGLRTESAGVLEDHALLPKPALGLEAMTLAAGCAELDRRCLLTLARSADAKAVRLRVSRGRPSDTFEVTIADRDGVAPYRSAVHPVDADSGPELRYHLARALGAPRSPPPARLAPSAPLPPDVDVWLDDRLVPRSALEDVGPGTHRVELRGARFDTVVWTGHARPGRTVSFPVDGLRPRAARIAESMPSAQEGAPSLLHTWWLAGAAALTLGVVVPVLGVEVEAQEAEVRAAGLSCADAPLPAPCQEGFDRATRTNVAIGAGSALAIGAVVAFFLEGGPRWLRGLAVGRGPGAGLAVGGRF